MKLPFNRVTHFRSLLYFKQMAIMSTTGKNSRVGTASDLINLCSNMLISYSDWCSKSSYYGNVSLVAGFWAKLIICSDSVGSACVIFESTLQPEETGLQICGQTLHKVWFHWLFSRNSYQTSAIPRPCEINPHYLLCDLWKDHSIFSVNFKVCAPPLSWPSFSSCPQIPQCFQLHNAVSTEQAKQETGLKWHHFPKGCRHS